MFLRITLVWYQCDLRTRVRLNWKQILSKKLVSMKILLSWKLLIFIRNSFIFRTFSKLLTKQKIKNKFVTFLVSRQNWVNAKACPGRSFDLRCMTKALVGIENTAVVVVGFLAHCAVFYLWSAKHLILQGTYILYIGIFSLTQQIIS